MTRITTVRSYDLGLPTAMTLDGSDALNPDPEYSAAYLVPETDGAYQGDGLSLAIGGGTKTCLAAIDALASRVAGKSVWALVAEMSPEEIAQLIDFRRLTVAIAPSEPMNILRRAAPGPARRQVTLLKEGYPCYTTSAGCGAMAEASGSARMYSTC